MISQRLFDLSKNSVFMHTGGWLFFAGAFLLSISGFETIQKSTMMVLALFLPSIPAVYLHLFAFEKFLRNKKYFAYIISIVVIISVFGQLIEYITVEGIFKDEDDVYIAGKLTLGAMILVSTGIRYFFIGLETKSKLAEIETKQIKAELDSLKLQVNPHFLFNSLNNIYGLLQEDVDRAGNSILSLSSLLRYLIYASQKTTIGLEEEVSFLENYIQMERLRLGDKCTLTIEKKGDFSDKHLSPFLLIPFVENAFKHGSFATIDKSFIYIEIIVENNALSFIVKNSIKTHAQNSTEGVGIANVKRRLELLFPNNYQLKVESLEDVFLVNLKLELT